MSLREGSAPLLDNDHESSAHFPSDGTQPDAGAQQSEAGALLRTPSAAARWRRLWRVSAAAAVLSVRLAHLREQLADSYVSWQQLDEERILGRGKQGAFFPLASYCSSFP